MATISLVYIPESLHVNHNSNNSITCLDRNEIQDRILIMKSIQETIYRSFCQNSRSNRRYGDNNKTNNMIAALRGKMCGWLYQAVDHCHLSRDLVAIAISYVDRYVNTEIGVRNDILCDRNKYQLAVLTALQLAMKIHGITIGIPHADNDEYVTIVRPNLIHSCRGIFEESEVIQMEYSMLTALEWRVNGPSPIDFLNYFLALLPTAKTTTKKATEKETATATATATIIRPNVINTIFSTARYQIELAVAEPLLFVNCIPSELAIAAISNSVAEISTKCFPFMERLQFFTELEWLCPFNNNINTTLEDNKNGNNLGNNASSSHYHNHKCVSDIQNSLSLPLIGISPSITPSTPNSEEKQLKQQHTHNNHIKHDTTSTTAACNAPKTISPTQCNIRGNQSNFRKSIIQSSFS